MSGLFITLEGTEGGGKSTQIELLKERLNKDGHDVVTLREPGGTAIGEEIRHLLKHSEASHSMCAETELLLMCASRAQLVREVIRPALDAGKIVVCDRFHDSTIAYQGYGHRVNLAQLRSIVDFATGGLKPDLTLLLDLDVTVGLTRRQKDGGINRLDAFELAFHQRVRAGYHELADAVPDRLVIIDAAQPPPQVQHDLRAAIMARMV